MTDKLQKLERFDTWIENDSWSGGQWIGRVYHKNGDFIEVSELLSWIQTHVSEGSISNVYSDLLKALGEGDKQ
jgi:hypothetical protein